MRCSWVFLAWCGWATASWAGPLPIDQRQVAEPEAQVSLVEVAPPAQPGPELLATAWLADAPPTHAADLANAPADRHPDGANAAQADPVAIVAVAVVAEVPADASRWLSREWSSLPADYRALPDTVRHDEQPVEVPRAAVVALGVLAAGVAVAVLARLWLRRRPAKPQGLNEHRSYHRARVHRH